MTPTTQINARISAPLKSAGDIGLEAAGLSTSEAVRALWELAARYKDMPEKLHAALFPDEETKRERALAKERERKAKLIRDSSNMFVEYLEARGLDPYVQVEMPTDEEAEEMVLLEELGEDSDLF